jgi:hypothetical protein
MDTSLNMKGYNMTTLSNHELNDLFRYCADIGMYATDRPINDTANHEGSCVHRTSFCDVTVIT